MTFGKDYGWRRHADLGWDYLQEEFKVWSGISMPANVCQARVRFRIAFPLGILHPGAWHRFNIEVNIVRQNNCPGRPQVSGLRLGIGLNPERTGVA